MNTNLTICTNIILVYEMGREVIGKRQPCPWWWHGTMRERESSHSQITNTTQPTTPKETNKNQHLKPKNMVVTNNCYSI